MRSDEQERSFCELREKLIRILGVPTVNRLIERAVVEIGRAHPAMAGLRCDGDRVGSCLPHPNAHRPVSPRLTRVRLLVELHAMTDSQLIEGITIDARAIEQYFVVRIERLNEPVCSVLNEPLDVSGGHSTVSFAKNHSKAAPCSKRPAAHAT